MELVPIDIIGILVFSVMSLLVCRVLHYNERRFIYTAAFLAVFSALLLIFIVFVLKDEPSLLKDISTCVFGPLFVLGYWFFCRPQSKKEKNLMRFVGIVGLIPSITRLLTILVFALFCGNM